MKKALFGLLLSLLCLIGCTAPAQGEPEPPPAQSALAAQSLPEPPPPIAAQEAQRVLDGMTDEEVVGQLFFVRYPGDDDLAAAWAQSFHLGGYILFGRDFKEDTPEGVREKIAACQAASTVPMLMGVDEEGGSVVRASRYPAFREKKFSSPQALFAAGGLEAIRADAAEKSAFLLDLGLNVNLAPVCDVSTDPNDFIYDRTLGQDARATAEYIAAVVEVMSQEKMGSVLKHFPGYGNNVDTHTGIAQDERPLTQLQQEDLLPFHSGVEAGAGAVLVSHNIVTCLDSQLPASLSPAAYGLLRSEVGFEGVAMTDDLDMDAVKAYVQQGSAAAQAISAGADMVLTSDPESQIRQVLSALETGGLDWGRVREAALRVLCWKVELGLIPS